MKAKFPGRCRYCSKAITIGEDEYEIETKTNYHVRCRDKQEPDRDPERIADACGFVPAASVEGPGWAVIHEGWVLWRVHAGPVGAAARRTGTEAPGRNGDLFGG